MFQLAPDSYRFQFGSAMIADFVFTVAADGKIKYDTDCDGFLSGRGTSMLTISGLEVTLDALHLTGADRALHTGVLLANAQLVQILPTDWISLGTIRLLPAKGYGVIVGSALVASFAFDLKRDGTFDYNPAFDSSRAGFLSGMGTSKLTLLGYPLTVDATAVSNLLIIPVNNFPASHTGKADVVLLPLKGYPLQFASGPSNMSFNLELDGKISVDPSVSDSLKLENEAGKPVLRVQNTSPARGTDLTVTGDLTVKGQTVMEKNARVDGKLGIGVVNPVANVQVNQPGLGVGIFLGDRTPFGQALFETDLSAPATHAFFAENGQPVFFVSAGGGGFFKGNLDVGGDAEITGHATIDGGAEIFAQPFPQSLLNPCFAILAGSDSKFHQRAGVYGESDQQGVTGVTDSPTGTGVYGGGAKDLISDQQIGVRGETVNGVGVDGLSFSKSGGTGVWGESNGFDGVHGVSHTIHNAGVAGINDKGGIGVFGQGTTAGLFVGDVTVAGTETVQVLSITGTGGADVAESFRMSTPEIPKGSVVVIDDQHEGQLRISNQAYDPRVAGIVSGANGIHPGMALLQDGAFGSGQNVALSGRVYVLVDASSSPINPGDLLTTSDTPGHAMKVTDHARAQGAVIGKAMSAMKEGQGLVLVLVTLQ